MLCSIETLTDQKVSVQALLRAIFTSCAVLNTLQRVTADNQLEEACLMSLWFCANQDLDSKNWLMGQD